MREIRENRGKKPYGGPLFMGLLVALAILAGAAVTLLTRFRPPQKIGGLTYEVNVVAGDIPGKSEAERQKELDPIVEEGMLAMSTNATPSGKGIGSDRSVDRLIENPSSQGKLIRVEIYRGDTREEICETGAIKPGNCVESAPPNVGLPIGEYDCTTRFYTYRLETEEYIGQAAVKIRLVIYK